MQKLVTVLLHETNSSDSHHGAVEEHLDEYLGKGWRVRSVTPIGHTGGQSRGTRAWMAVVLERKRSRSSEG
jgi:hypothetical protein